MHSGPDDTSALPAKTSPLINVTSSSCLPQPVASFPRTRNAMSGTNFVPLPRNPAPEARPGGE
eukprot:2047521-Rhodomonas_salina.3